MEKQVSENIATQLLRNMAGIVISIKNIDAKLDWILVHLTKLEDKVEKAMCTDKNCQEEKADVDCCKSFSSDAVEFTCGEGCCCNNCGGSDEDGCGSGAEGDTADK